MTAFRSLFSRRGETPVGCPATSSAPAKSRKRGNHSAHDLLAASAAASVEALERRALLSGSNFGPADPLPPSAVFAPLSSVTAATAAGESIQVTYADNAAIDIASVGTDNLVVTGPGGQTLPVVSASADTNAYAAVVNVTYTLPAPAGG